MKAFNKATISAAVITVALGISAAHAGPYGYGYGAKIGFNDYNNSFNTTNETKTRIDNSKRFKHDYQLDYDIDNSVRNDYRLKYDLRTDKINAGQRLNQLRSYSSERESGRLQCRWCNRPQHEPDSGRHQRRQPGRREKLSQPLRS